MAERSILDACSKARHPVSNSCLRCVWGEFARGNRTGKIVMRLIMKSNPLFIPVNTNTYTLSLDRFQMAIGHKYTSTFNGLAGGMLAGESGGPAAVPSADVNHDGTLDANDIIVFVQDFVDSSLSADLNDDGDVAVDDVIEFVQQLAP